MRTNLDFLSYWTNLRVKSVNISISQEFLSFFTRDSPLSNIFQNSNQIFLNPIHVGINSWYFYRKSNLTIYIYPSGAGNGVKIIQRQVDK